MLKKTLSAMTVVTGVFLNSVTTISAHDLSAKASLQQSVAAIQYNHWVAVDGKRTGPHGLPALKQLIAQGKLTPQSLVWKDGMQNWLPAAQVSDIARLFSSPGQGAASNIPAPQIPGGQDGQGSQRPRNNPALNQLEALERQDFGVPASNQLHTGPMHGPTPNRIPGGQVITTKGMVELTQSKQVKYLLFDVLGSNVTLPGAIPAAPAAQAGSFQDAIQQQMNNYLQQATGGNKQTPLIFYCQSVQCWMSYNAALRAINLGYTNVLWYRGGLEAWQQAGLPTVPANQNMSQQFR